MVDKTDAPEKPIGVLIIGWYMVVSSVLAFPVILLLGALPSFLSESFTISATTFHIIYAGIGILFLLSVFNLVTGIFLLRLRSWARGVTLGLNFFSIVLSMASVIVISSLFLGGFNASIFLQMVSGLAIPGAIIYYLSRNDVKQAFK